VVKTSEGSSKINVTPHPPPQKPRKPAKDHLKSTLRLILHNRSPEKTMGNSQSGAPAAPTLGKSGKKICCSCPETKKARDECIVMKGEELCKDLIEKHKVCLRQEGFTVK